jgi:hypothetical protein
VGHFALYVADNNYGRIIAVPEVVRQRLMKATYVVGHVV